MQVPEFLFGTMCGLLLVSGASNIVQEYDMRKLKAEAVERGYALYCPADGEWAWVEECE